MSAYLDDAKDHRVSIDDIRKRATSVSDATADYTRLRGDYQRRALAILNPEQKARWQKIRRETEDDR